MSYCWPDTKNDTYLTFSRAAEVAVQLLNGPFLTVRIAVLDASPVIPNVRAKFLSSNQIYKDSTFVCGVKGEPEAAAERNEVSTERVRIQA